LGKELGDFRQAWIRLLFRLVTIVLIGASIATTPTILAKADGWAFFLNGFDLIFEVFLYFLAIGLCGAIGASALAVLIAPLLVRASSRDRVSDISVKLLVCVVVFVDLRAVLGSLNAHVGVHSARGVSLLFLT
jgi:hypothetical protein